MFITSFRNIQYYFTTKLKVIDIILQLINILVVLLLKLLVHEFIEYEVYNKDFNELLYISLLYTLKSFCTEIYMFLSLLWGRLSLYTIDSLLGLVSFR